MTNIKLSPHFKLYEFCVTSSGANVVQANREYASEPENVEKLTFLASKILEPIRAEMIKPSNNFGVKFMTITSGVRTAGTKIANASKTSQHNHCEACDFVINGKIEDTARFYRMIVEGKIPGLEMSILGQVILERKLRGNKTWSNWIHISGKYKRFLEQRKAAGRNYTNFPEFYISLDGYTYPKYNEINFKKYLDTTVKV